MVRSSDFDDFDDHLTTNFKEIINTNDIKLCRNES